MRARGYDTKVEYSDCGAFMNTIVYHALGKKAKVIAGVKEAFPTAIGMKVVFSGTSVKQRQLKRGDIIRYKNTNGTSQHTLLYLGNGLIAEAGRETRFGVIKKSTKYTGKKKVVEVLRAVEDTTTRDYMQFGDNGENTKLLQQYLNWYKPSYNLVINGKWDNSTDLAVKDMQTDFFGASGADGKVGEKTLKEMEAVKK